MPLFESLFLQLNRGSHSKGVFECAQVCLKAVWIDFA
jgi:hypothetical protein